MNKSILIYYLKRKLQNQHFQQLRLICNQHNQQENDAIGEGPISITTTSVNTVNKNNQKLNKIAIIGLPNAGKSTFINSLISHRVSIIIFFKVMKFKT